MTPPAVRASAAASPPSPRYDLVIIGAGPAGLAAAELAARLGAKVALIERAAIGGTSLNTGSVPSKALIRMALLFSHIRETGRLSAAGHPEGKADLRRVADQLERIRARIAAYRSVDILQRSGIDVLAGVARFDGPASLAVNGTRLEFDRAIIATGSRPRRPDIPGLVAGHYLTSDSVFGLDTLPEHLAVVGGGPLGCELAQAFCRLGAQVTIIQNDPKFLPREERDAANVLSESMARDGVSIYLNTTVVGARTDGAATLLDTVNNDLRCVVRADRVLVSVGRVPNVDDLGLEAAGVAFDAERGITVDACLRTTNERIYAAGDVCMADKFTPVAERTARIAVNNLLRGTEQRHTDLVTPWCTFCDPEIAHVGMQVWEARAQSIPVKTYSVLMQDVDRAITDRQATGFVKVHVQEGTDRILGATIVAARASEMINEICVAMSAGIGLRDLGRSVHSYPAQSRAMWMAATAYEADVELPAAAAAVRLRLARP